MKTSDFRNEIKKIMPGYKWTVHKDHLKGTALFATGIQSSGFNRTSTLQISRFENGESVRYEVKSSGFGKRAPWLHTTEDRTLTRALRSLQNHYEAMANSYRSHAGDLQCGRRPA